MEFIIFLCPDVYKLFFGFVFKEQEIVLIVVSGHRLCLDIGLGLLRREIFGDGVVAVIEASYGYWSVRVTVEEVDDHFGVDPRDKLAAPAIPCREVGKSDIAAGWVFGIKVEDHSDTSKLVHIDGIGCRLCIMATTRDSGCD
jgi:hypothetical protein